MPRQRMLQRPDTFTLNNESPLARGLVFAGLGQGRGSLTMRDASPRRNNGTLTNMTPGSAWVWSQKLRRMTTVSSATNSYIAVPVVWTFPALSFFTWAYRLGLTQQGLIASLTVNIIDFFHYSDHALYLDTWEATTRKRLTVAANVPDGWHAYCAVVNDSTQKEMFIDGASRIAFTPGVHDTAANGMRVANRAGSDASGQRRADTMLWNRVLSLGEIRALADPANIDLRIGNTPLILGPRRMVFPAAGTTPPATGNRRRRLLIAGVSR